MVNVAGKQLEVVWHGPRPEAAPTLVFLHEGLGCVKMWRDFPARLCQETGCSALVYSRQGYGSSDPVPLPRPLDYMQKEAQLALPALLAAMGVRQAILIGHSDGASIAIVYAGCEGRGTHGPARVLGLVLEAPHLFCEELSVRSIESAKKEYEHGNLRERLRRYHGDNVDGAFWGWNRAWLDPDFRFFNLEGFLPDIRVPILCIQGEEDSYGTLRQLEALEQGAAGPVQRLLLPACGHAPHKDRPDETFTAIAAFIRQVLKRSAG